MFLVLLIIGVFSKQVGKQNRLKFLESQKYSDKAVDFLQDLALLEGLEVLVNICIGFTPYTETVKPQWLVH